MIFWCKQGYIISPVYTGRFHGNIEIDFFKIPPGRYKVEVLCNGQKKVYNLNVERTIITIPITKDVPISRVSEIGVNAIAKE